MMPHKLLHLDRFPFFGSLMIVPLFQSSSITLLSQTSWLIYCRSCGISCSSAFSISEYTLSYPGALPFFSFLIASLTSWTVMSPILNSRSCSASLMSAGVGRSPKVEELLKVFSQYLLFYLFFSDR